MKNIVLAFPSREETEKYRELLTINGYNITGEAEDGIDLVLMCRENVPDMVLLDEALPYCTAAEETLTGDSLCRMIFCISDRCTEGLMDKVRSGRLSGCLVRPVGEKDIIPALTAAFLHYEKMRKLRQSYENIEKQIDFQRIVEQAKNVLMQEKGISLKEAEVLLSEISKAKKLEIIETAKILTYTK